jgi:hypothetical protein
MNRPSSKKKYDLTRCVSISDENEYINSQRFHSSVYTEAEQTANIILDQTAALLEYKGT